MRVFDRDANYNKVPAKDKNVGSGVGVAFCHNALATLIGARKTIYNNVVDFASGTTAILDHYKWIDDEDKHSNRFVILCPSSHYIAAAILRKKYDIEINLFETAQSKINYEEIRTFIEKYVKDENNALTKYNFKYSVSYITKPNSNYFVQQGGETCGMWSAIFCDAMQQHAETAKGDVKSENLKDVCDKKVAEYYSLSGTKKDANHYVNHHERARFSGSSEEELNKIDKTQEYAAPISLAKAVEEKNLDAARIALKTTPLNRDDSFGLLMQAIENLQPEMVELLLKAGADINAVNEGISVGSLLLNLLITKMPQIRGLQSNLNKLNNDDHKKNKDRITSVLSICNILLDQKDICLSFRRTREPKDAQQSNLIYNSSHYQPLYVALGHAPIEIIKKMLDNGASTENACFGFLDRRKYNSLENDSKEILDLILQKDPNALKVVDNSNKSPLHHIAQNDNTYTLRAMLEAGADINLKDINGKTPLALAFSSDASEVVEILIKNKNLQVNCDAIKKCPNLYSGIGVAALCKQIKNGGYVATIQKTIANSPLDVYVGQTITHYFNEKGVKCQFANDKEIIEKIRGPVGSTVKLVIDDQEVECKRTLVHGKKFEAYKDEHYQDFAGKDRSIEMDGELTFNEINDLLTPKPEVNRSSSISTKKDDNINQESYSSH